MNNFKHDSANNEYFFLILKLTLSYLKTNKRIERFQLNNKYDL